MASFLPHPVGGDSYINSPHFKGREERSTHTLPNGRLSMSHCKTSLWNRRYIDTATLGKYFLPQSPSVIPRLRRSFSTHSPSTQLLQFSCSNSLHLSFYVYPPSVGPRHPLAPHWVQKTLHIPLLRKGLHSVTPKLSSGSLF